LQNSLPPMVLAEPLTGIALGVALLGDRVAHTPLALLAEASCLLAMLLGAVLIGRSGALQPGRGTLGGRARVRMTGSRAVPDAGPPAGPAPAAPQPQG
jgi:hypothetical protein